MQILSMTEPWTLILDDALANSFIAPATDDIKDDHQLICEFSCANLDKEQLSFLLFFFNNFLLDFSELTLLLEGNFLIGLFLVLH